jgi:hypothetical protein
MRFPLLMAKATHTYTFKVGPLIRSSRLCSSVAAAFFQSGCFESLDYKMIFTNIQPRKRSSYHDSYSKMFSRKLLVALSTAYLLILSSRSLSIATVSLPASLSFLDNISGTATSLWAVSNYDSFKFACILLIAGCDPDKPAYRGFVYNAVAAAYMLKDSGMDFHVMIRMSGRTDMTRLPKEDETILQRANITIRYLPKTADDTFYTAMMDKFVVLEYVQYDRVLFLDADVLPLCNLRPLMLQTMIGGLKPNVVLQWRNEPASGGFFILKPGRYQRFEQIVAEQRRRQVNKTDFFDEYWGWGQPMYHDWTSMRKGRGTNWTFYGAYADQGLLYHWVLYEQQSVSIIAPSEILHYAQGPSGRVVLAKKTPNFLKSCVPQPWRDFAWKDVEDASPHCDFYHYSGWRKPWLDMPNITITEEPLHAIDAIDLWHSILGRISKEWALHFRNDLYLSGLAPLGECFFRSYCRRRNDIYSDHALALALALHLYLVISGKGPVRKFLQHNHLGIVAKKRRGRGPR